MTGSIRNIIKQCTPLLPLFLLIYTSDDTIMFGMFGDVRFYYAKLAVWFSVAMYFAAKGYFLRNKFTVSLFIVAILYFVNSIVSGFSIGFVYNLAIFLLALVYVSNNSFETFREHFCRIVCFLALASSIVYVVNLIMPQVFAPFPTLYNAANLPYTTVYVSSLFHSLPLRNFGIFREPGMYMIYLNLALFFEWFSSQPNKFRVIVYVFTLLTTVSTGGIFIGALIICAGSIMRRNYSVIIMVLPVLFVGYYFLFQEDSVYYTLLLGKLEQGNGTTIARLSSVTVPLKIFMEYPLGAGPGRFNDLFPIICNQMYGEALDADLSTNTLTKNLAVYGPLVFLLYFTYLVRFTKMSFQSGSYRLLFLFVLILAMSNEDIRSSILYFIILAYGASYNKNIQYNEYTIC